ncbi:two-component system sensor histidine kinase CreC [Psychrobacter sp. PL15]|uniref:two-component system sensor histidine kinase CreC n=1 Tax=Psychrobacter sp. PL15 TaxID=3071719 RepID=UPI002E089FEE|nr:two-component system sensor histidine kinase CreC [Psychrobacter sp. PL15]
MTLYKPNSANHKANNRAKISQTNWYAKLHPIGTAQQTKAPKTTLNLSIFFRVWLALALVLIICGMVVFNQLFGYVKPIAQQVIEDTLLDTSKLLAASLQMPLRSGELYSEAYQTQLDSAFTGAPVANILTSPQYEQQIYSRFRVYVTDSDGTVVYDSLPTPANSEGKDYSRWNDVYLTLEGEYGARSTVRDDFKRNSSVMYVAQPITDPSGNLIGVVSVGKPVASVSPYLDNTRRRMFMTALLVSIIALILAGLVAWWLKQSINLVTQYTDTLAEDTQKPYFYLGHELNSLTDTIETMKHRLENRAYVTDYVHTLTHELKSPLTAIRASSELLEDDSLDNDDRQMLSHTISEQSVKMQQLIDRLLLLAKVEQPTFKLNRQALLLLPMLYKLVNESGAKLQQQHLAPIAIYVNGKLLIGSPEDNNDQVIDRILVYVDHFWLVQALQNILDNAIYFANNIVTIYVHTSTSSTVTGTVTIDIFNDGKLIPDYAVSKIFDRYFSLSHQSSTNQTSIQNLNNVSISTPKKGTGLGLTLVKQVMEHHGGSVTITNVAADSSRTRDISIYPAIDQSEGVLVSMTLLLTEPIVG